MSHQSQSDTKVRVGRFLKFWFHSHNLSSVFTYLLDDLPSRILLTSPTFSLNLTSQPLSTLAHPRYKLIPSRVVLCTTGHPRVIYFCEYLILNVHYLSCTRSRPNSTSPFEDIRFRIGYWDLCVPFYWCFLQKYKYENWIEYIQSFQSFSFSLVYIYQGLNEIPLEGLSYHTDPTFHQVVVSGRTFSFVSQNEKRIVHMRPVSPVCESSTVLVLGWTSGTISSVSKGRRRFRGERR